MNRFNNCKMFTECGHCITNAFGVIKTNLRELSEWEEAKEWAKTMHPNWVRLATQTQRPEIRETYRQKILRGYFDGAW
jgi:hypothetical protein